MNSAVAPLTQLNLHLNEGSSTAARSCLATHPTPAGQCDPSPCLAVDQAEQAVRESLPLGLRTVVLTGGEPFCAPEWDTLLERLSALPVALAIQTNGSPLRPERAARLAALPRPPSLSVGLAFPDPFTQDEDHPAQLQVFKSAVQTVTLLSKAGLPVQTVFTLCRQNIALLPEMIRLSESLGARSVRFQLAQPAAESQSETEHSDLYIAEIIALGRRIERNYGVETRLPLYFDQPQAFRGLQTYTSSDGADHCTLLNSLSVLPDGQISLCETIAPFPELHLGRVSGEASIAQLWANHPLLTDLRARLPHQLQGVCSRCSFKQTCVGHCPLYTYTRSKSFTDPYWFCQAAEQVGLFPASRLLDD